MPTRCRCNRLFVFVAALIVIMGCNEIDRQTARDMAAEEVCAEAERCDNLGDDGLHPTHADCIVEERLRFDDAWPENECGGGSIDIDAFDRCIDRALEVACHDRPLDWMVATEVCASRNVCSN